MKEVAEMPKTGQFVAIWKNENGIWGSTFKWSETGILCEYNEYYDEFKECGFDLTILNAAFFVLDDLLCSVSPITLDLAKLVAKQPPLPKDRKSIKEWAKRLVADISKGRD